MGKGTLVTRSLSGLVFTAIVVAGLLYPLATLALAVLLAVGLSIEFYRLASKRRYRKEEILVMAAIVLTLLLFYLGRTGVVAPAFPLLGAVPVLAAGICQLFDGAREQEFVTEPYFPLIYVLPALLSLLCFPWRISLGLFIILWCSDIGAYCVGMLLGQRAGSRKLFPALSPKKSWIGVLGGAVFAFLAAWAYWALWGAPALPLVHWMLLAVLVHGEGHTVAVVSGLRSSPGGVGDGVVDNGGTVAIVGVDGHVAIDAQDGGKGLPQRLGGVGGRFAGHVHDVGVHADVAVAQVVNSVGGNLVAVQASAVGRLDGGDGVGGEGRIGDVDGAGDDAVELVVIGGALLEVDVLGLGLALEVVLVGLIVDDAVLELDELIGAGAHGDGGLGADRAQVALGEAKGVVVIIIQALVAIVVDGSDGNAQLRDGSGVDLGHDHTHVVVVDLLDAGDVGSGLTGLNAGLVLVTQVGNGQAQQRGASGLHFLSLSDVAVIGLNNGGPEIGSGGVLSNLEAPQGRALGHGGGAIVGAVVNDLLGKQRASLVVIEVPEGLVLILGVEVVLLISAVAVSKDHVAAAVHAGAIGLEAFDGLGKQRGAAVIGGIAENVHGEDHVVDGDRLAVRELQVVAELDVIVNGAVIVLSDSQVSGTIVGIIGAVVGDGLALDALLDHSAGTVAVQQVHLGHSRRVLIVSSLREERGELAVEGRIAHHQRRGIFLFSRFRSGSGLGGSRCCGLSAGGAGVAVAAAGCQQRYAHAYRQDQRQQLQFVAHCFSSLKIFEHGIISFFQCYTNPFMPAPQAWRKAMAFRLLLYRFSHLKQRMRQRPRAHSPQLSAMSPRKPRAAESASWPGWSSRNTPSPAAVRPQRTAATEVRTGRFLAALS